jgi:hypothetical protein
MRTTVTLDADVAAEIERVRRQDGRRFKHVLNDALRLGLRSLAAGPDRRPLSSPTVPRDLGEQLVDIVDVSVALARAEGDDHR